MNMHTVLKPPPAAERPVLQAQAWRLSFPAAAPDQQPPLAVINEPSNVVVVATAVELNDALALAADPGDGSLMVVWVPSATGSAVDLDSRLHTWIRQDLAPNQSPVHASIKTVRATCSDTRAVIYAAPEHLSDTMDAVARFTLAARHTAALEACMAATENRAIHI